MSGDVVVIGAGVIGLGIAWRCAQRGLSVTVLDPSPGSGASRTAAGMLAPVTELHFGEDGLLELNLASAARYPRFVADLREATGHDVGYLRSGSVVAAWDAADLAGLRDLREYAASLGQQLQLLTGRELRRAVPMLAAGLPGGAFAPDDHQVDNRRLHSALLAAAVVAGATIMRDRAVELMIDSGRVRAVRTDNGVVAAGTVVLAAGAWSRQLSGVPPEILPPVRPVKGQTVRLRVDGPVALPHTVRGTIKGSPVYVVPRSDGELVVGASSEDAGFDLRPRAGAVYELLRDAQSLLPALSEAELVEVSTSVRPGSPDNAPIVGPTTLDGLVVATGHYRNGILLTPMTADGVADLLADGELPTVLQRFTPDRFHSKEIAAWT